MKYLQYFFVGIALFSVAFLLVMAWMANPLGGAVLTFFAGCFGAQSCIERRGLKK